MQGVWGLRSGKFWFMSELVRDRSILMEVSGYQVGPTKAEIEGELTEDTRRVSEGQGFESHCCYFSHGSSIKYFCLFHLSSAVQLVLV